MLPKNRSSKDIHKGNPSPAPSRRDVSGISDTRSIISKSRTYSKYKIDRSFHDYEFVACKVIQKEGLNKKRLELIENEIAN